MWPPDAALAIIDTTAHVAAALVFAAVLTHFERQEGRVYLRFWRLSWLAFAVLAIGALAGRLTALSVAANHPLRLALSTVSIAGGLLQGAWLCAGVREFARRERLTCGFGWPLVAGALVLGAALTLAWVDDPAMRTWRFVARVGVRTAVTSLAFLSAAVWLYLERRRHGGILTRLLPGALAGYGLNQWPLLIYGPPVGAGASGAADTAVAYLDLFLQLLIGIGMVLWLLEVERDERRAEARRVLESEGRYRTLVESAPDAILTIDARGVIVFANPMAEATFGYGPQELVGRPLTDIVPGEQADVLLAGEDRPGRPWTALNVTARHFTGRDLAVEVSLTEHTVGTGRRTTAIVRDVSDRRRMEAQLLQAQKMEAIGRMTGGIAHDFSNLLTAIGGQAEIALSASPPGSTMHGRLSEIRRSVDRGSELTRRLLAFSRQEPIATRLVDLNAAVLELGGVLRRLIGEDVTVSFDLAPGPLPVLADPSQLDQALLNLAVNGRDAMPTGGRLVISTAIARVDADAAVAYGRARQGTFAQLKVSDTGSGIAPEHLPRIFDPFFTTKAADRGTGLGLAITYGVVKQHGGWIDVDSQVGRGTSFTIHVPLASMPAATPQPDMWSAAPAAGRGETVLVVEDEAPVRALVIEALTSSGYVVREAGSGPEALDVWRDHGARVDLILCDMVMPDGLNGVELVTRLRADRPDVRVVLMSGYQDQGDRVDRAGFLAKPFSLVDLLGAVRQHLDAPVS